jgi:hypothetical protein
MADIIDEASRRAANEEIIASETKRLETIRSLGDAYKDLFKNEQERDAALLESSKRMLAALNAEKEARLALGTDEAIAKAKELQAQIVELGKTIEGLEKKATSFGQAFKKSLKDSVSGYSDLFTNQVIKPITIGATLQAIPALDRLRAEFTKNTGASQKLADQITKVQGNFVQFGIKNEEAAKILQGVYLDFNRFGVATDSLNKKIIDNAAMFSKLGVPAEQYAKSVSLSSTALGLSSEEAIENQKTLAKTAVALNMSIGDLNNKFLSGMRNFAVYGKQATDQFVKLTAISKATNVEMTTLQGITERLTTFEETGQFAGRLNAIVGKDLFDAVTLASLEGEEKVNYIREQLRTGFDFENMSPQMLRAVSKAAGIEIADLKGLTGAQATQDISARQQQVADAKLESDEKLVDTAKRATSAQDKLGAAQEAQRNAVIESTGALEKYQGLMGGLTTATQFLTGVSSAASAALASLATIYIPILNARIMGSSVPAPGGGGGLGGAGFMGKYGKGMGIGLGLGLTGMAVSAATKDSKSKTTRDIGNTAGRALEFAGMGASIGTFIAPGIGTAVGGLIGGAVGAGYGAYENSQADKVPVQDAIVQPLKKGTLKPRPDDGMLAIGTNLKGSSNKNMVEKLLAEQNKYLSIIAGNTEKDFATRTGNPNSSMYA